MTTDGASGASRQNSQYDRNGDSDGPQPGKQQTGKQDNGKRLLKMVVAIALLLIVAVFIVILLVTGRTDDDQPEQPRPAATVTSTG